MLDLAQAPERAGRLKHLSGQAALYQQGFPARQSVAQSPAFTSTAQPGASDVYNAYLAAMQNAPTSPDESIYDSKIDFYWLFRALDRALQGKDLERELSNAQRTTEQYMACVEGKERPSVCAKQADPRAIALNFVL